MSATHAAPDRMLALPRVAAALAAILVLALALPYAAVQSLHHRRLGVADRQLQSIAAAVATGLTVSPAVIPAATQLLAGAGPRPTVLDDLWATASGFPLARVMDDPGVDPWGNAYLVNIRDRAHAWVISAGPDGILQTPFTHGPPTQAGDDSVALVR